MDRRFFLTAMPCLALAGAARAALPDAEVGPRYTVSAAHLEWMLTQHFPLRYPVAGLLDLALQAPRLHMLPEQNRLSAQMRVEASGPALPRRQQGSFDVDFALRYEASDRTLRAMGLRFRNLRFPDLQPAASEWLNAYGPALAEQSMLEVVLHQLRAQDLALADAMGLQPGPVTVTQEGLMIGFVAKQR